MNEQPNAAAPATPTPPPTTAVVSPATPAPAPVSAPTPAVASQPAPVVADSESPIVPEVWPGAFGILNNSKRAVMNNLPAFLVPIAAGIVISIIFNRKDQSIWMSLFGFVLNMIVTTFVYSVSLAAVRGGKVDLKAMATYAAKTFWKIALLSFIVGIAAGVGLLLFIVPGVILIGRLSMAPYFLVEQNMSIGAALSASWAQTKGHTGKIWGVLGISILFGFAIIIVIGIYLTFIYSAAMAILYYYIKAHPVAVVAPDAPAAPTPAAPVAG
jgi:hypothetical protein